MVLLFPPRPPLSAPPVRQRMFVALLSLIPLLLGGVLVPQRGPLPVVPTLPSLDAVPLSFVPNVGQLHPEVHFQVQDLHRTLFFTDGEIVLSSPSARPAAEAVEQGTIFDAAPPSEVVRVRFADANPAPAITGAAALPGIVNYFIGNTPTQWRTGVPTYAGVVYHDLYPGIDLHYDGTAGRLKGTYSVAPGANPDQIRWTYGGAHQVALDGATGDLQIALGDDAHTRLTEHAPIAWQTVDGQRVPVAVHYTLDATGSVGFAVAAYDRTLPLTIDPTLVYSTFVGGGGDDIGVNIAVDRANNVYLTGGTDSADFPTKHPLQASVQGNDAFVTKLSADGQTLLYSTYFGGTGTEYGQGITVDETGAIAVVGITFSTDFPTKNPRQGSFGGGLLDGFVAKFNPAGTGLIYATYLGGSANDIASKVTTDPAGNTYVVGATGSANFPTANALQVSSGGQSDAFVTKLTATGDAFVYSTFLGRSGRDEGLNLVVDAATNVYVVGLTSSPNFPLVHAVQAAYGGGLSDAFAAQINPAGTALVFSTYLGGSEQDLSNGVGMDGSGNLYVSGTTGSANFPTANALQPTYGGGFFDAFVAKLSPAPGTLRYSTFLGGSGDDTGTASAVTGAGMVAVTGYTNSTNFPRAQALQATYGGGPNDAFVAEVNAAGTALTFSTYLGGSDDDTGSGIVRGAGGNLYVIGLTASSNFPTRNPLQAAYGGGAHDVFVANIRTFSTTLYAPVVAK